MRRAEVQEKLNLAMAKHIQLTFKIDGVKKLYDAACFVGDGQEALKHRHEQHALLDAQMDVQSDLMTFSRMLITAAE